MDFFDNLKNNEDVLIVERERRNKEIRKLNTLKDELESLFQKKKQYEEYGSQGIKKQMLQAASKEFQDFMKSKGFKVEESQHTTINFIEIFAHHGNIHITLTVREVGSTIDLKIPSAEKYYTLIIEETISSERVLPIIQDVTEKDTLESIEKKILQYAESISIMKEVVDNLPNTKYVYRVYDSKTEYEHFADFMKSIK